MKLLTNGTDREEAYSILRVLLEARAEWLCSETAPSVGAARARGRSAPPRAASRETAAVVGGEWELSVARASLHFSYWSGAGLLRVWRVMAWEHAGDKLRLTVTRGGGSERATLELVPRASVGEAAEELTAARLAACERLAALACAAAGSGAKIESARLSRGARRTEPGRYARIVLGRGARGRVAVTGALVPLRAHEADAVLASALAWWSRVNESSAGRKQSSRRAAKLWLVAARALSQPLGERLALLREDVRDSVSLFETDDALETLTRSETPRLEELLCAPPRPRLAPRVSLSETAARVAALSPAEIDAVRARHGETLRFRGLPFARVRRVAGRERVWFTAAPGSKQKLLLADDNWPRLANLLDELAAHRRPDAPDASHAFYRAAPEAWLESILRRDITRLDPGLVLSPLHAQFRASHERGGAGARSVDLLALRRDGRLVVIELKVSEDAALPLQGADYWRRISTYNSQGHIARSRLFGGAEISAEPPLVYLVAPLLRFHRSFQTLARCIAPEIETYRFDINEDWRAGVRVMRRGRV